MRRARRAPKLLRGETWDALLLYSDLDQSQILSRLAKRKRKGEEEPMLQEWPEFISHRWGTLDDESHNRLEDVLTRLEGLFPQWSLQGGWLGQNVWIVKPGTNSKGSGIECMRSLPQLLQHCERMPNRIVQKYIERPLLLFSGRKFDIRQWVLVRSVRPLKVFLFSECYLRLCNGMYDLGDLQDRERHISNWQVNKHGKNVVEGAVVSLQDFKAELSELTGCEDYWESELLPQLKHIVIEVLRSAESRLEQRAESFELLGFDVMVDEAMKMWLLEVNLSPGCEGRTNFLERMLSRMSHRLIEVAVLGQEEPDGEEPDWIKICDDTGTNSGQTDAPRPADLSIQGTPLRPKAGKSAGYGIRESQAERPMQAEKPQPEEVVPQQQLPQPAQKPAEKPAAKAVPQQQLPQPAEKPTDKVVPQQQLPKPAEKPAENPAAKVIPQQQLPQPAEKPAEKVPQLPTTEKPAEPAAQMLPEKPPEKHPEPEQVRQALGVVRMVDELDEEEDPLDRFVYTDPAAQAHAANEPSEASHGESQEDEEARTVSFDPFAKAKDGDKPKEEVRKATGYVGLSDMPPADEEEDEEERTVSFDPSAKAKDGDEPKEQVRKATGYVSLSDMPDDEEEEERNVSFDPSAKAKDGDKPKEQVRKSTGYVSLTDMPPDEDDYEDNFEEEEEDAKPEAGEKAVSFDQATKDKEPSNRKAARKGTGYLHEADLQSMLEDEEDEAATSKRVAFDAAEESKEGARKSQATQRKGTGFLTAKELADLPLRTTTRCPLILPRRRAQTALASRRLHSARGLDSSQRRIWQTCHQTMRRQTVQTAQPPTKRRQLRRCLLRRRKRRSCHVIAEVQQTRRQPGRAPDSFEQMRCQRLRKITTTTTTLRRSSKMTSRRTRKVEAHEGRRGTSSGAGQWLSAEVTA
ncbi:unnamed protein product [Effrenium voratum]|nr:unnamed protein product [Effrenium voratum]